MENEEDNQYETTLDSMLEIGEIHSSIMKLINQDEEKLGNTKRIASKLETIIRLSLPLLEMFKPKSSFLTENSKGIKSQIVSLKKEIMKISKKLDSPLPKNLPTLSKKNSKNTKNTKNSKNTSQKNSRRNSSLQEIKENSPSLGQKKIKTIHKSIQCDQHSFLLNCPEFRTAGSNQNQKQNKNQKNKNKKSSNRLNNSQNILKILPATLPISNYFGIHHETIPSDLTTVLQSKVRPTTYSSFAFGKNNCYLATFLHQGYALIKDEVAFLEITDQSKKN